MKIIITANLIIIALLKQQQQRCTILLFFVSLSLSISHNDSIFP